MFNFKFCSHLNFKFCYHLNTNSSILIDHFCKTTTLNYKVSDRAIGKHKHRCLNTDFQQKNNALTDETKENRKKMLRTYICKNCI